MNIDSDLRPMEGDDEETLWRKAHAYCAERLGVTSMLYGFTHSRHLRARVGVSRSLLVRHSHPQEYVDHFGGQTFLENDLCTLVLMEASGPFMWADAAKMPDATPEQIRQAEIDHEFGMDVGVSLGFSFGGGHGMSGIGLCARWMDPAEFERRWRRESEAVIAWIGEFDRYMRPAMIAARFKLSPRQREVVALAVGGMLVKEIAAHLDLREGTVYNYLEAARTALDAATSMEAVAKALVYGLL